MGNTAENLRQTAEGKLGQHLRLHTLIHVWLCACTQHRHAGIAPATLHHARLVEKIRALARLDVIREGIPMVPRAHPVVVGLLNTVVDRRVVHVQDRAVRQDGGCIEVQRGGEECLHEVCP